jgi:DNA-binding transcriptional LysR family regulator
MRDREGDDVMDIRYLHSFIAVANCLNFTEAAKRIYIAQPVLSRQIALLEEQLGVKLFIRNNRSVHLTAAGTTLFQEAGALLANIEDIIERTRQSHTGTSGQLKVGCFGVESDFLPQIIGRFHTAYPRITLNLQQATIRMLETGLKNGDLDIAFSAYLGNEPQKSPFMHKEVRRSRLCFLLPRNHPYAQRQSLNFFDLRQEQFILLKNDECPHTNDWILKQCEKAGFVPTVIAKSNLMETVFWEVEAGIGISLALRDLLIGQTLNSRISLVTMEGDDAFGSLTVTWKNENSNPAIPLFIKEFDNLPQSHEA